MNLPKIRLVSAASVLLMVVILLIIPFGFSATIMHSLWTNTAYILTESAGVNGTLLGIFVACYLYTVQEIGFKNKMQVFAKAMVGLIAIISLFAISNEYLTKPYFRFQRPSHVYVLQKLHLEAKIDSLYQLPKEQRALWFRQKIQEEAKKFAEINPMVLEHWLNEAGFSFPSGHTFNAFLLACIFAFGIKNNSKIKQWQAFYFLPFLWAISVGISRVSLGVHTLQDVCTGALLGIIIGNILLTIDHSRHWITHKKQIT
jgi:phosphatidylglycerophosphatase B